MSIYFLIMVKLFCSQPWRSSFTARCIISIEPRWNTEQSHGTNNAIMKPVTHLKAEWDMPSSYSFMYYCFKMKKWRRDTQGHIKSFHLAQSQLDGSSISTPTQCWGLCSGLILEGEEAGEEGRCPTHRDYAYTSHHAPKYKAWAVKGVSAWSH